MIVFPCPACGRTCNVPDTAAGQAVTCAGCAQPLVVPVAFGEPETEPAITAVDEAPAPMGTRVQDPAPRPAGGGMPILVLAGAGILLIAALGIGIGLGLGRPGAPPAQAPAADQPSATPQVPAPEMAEPPQAPTPRAAASIPYLGSPPLAPNADPNQVKAAAIAAEILALREQQNVTFLEQERDRLARELSGSPAPPSEVAPVPAEPPAHQRFAAVADMVAHASPSVVTVTSELGSGSGWIAFERDLVVTNYHVIRHGTRFLAHAAVVAQGRKTSVGFPCDVVAVDLEHDLALLRMRTGSLADLAPLGLADKPVRPGEEVVAIGSPAVGATVLGQSVTTGVISSAERTIDGKAYLQANAAINPANSVGPLLNADGEVVGVVTAKGGAVEGIGFAVPVKFVKALYDGRATAFLVAEPFASWERRNALKVLADVAGAIPVRSVVNDMMLLSGGTVLVALATDRNKVLAIDTLSGRVACEIFPGTQPLQMQPGAGAHEVWVLCASSKSFALVDCLSGKALSTVHVLHSPIAFAIVRDRIWYVDQGGALVEVGFNGADETVIDLINVRSLAYSPSGRQGDLLCGSTGAWLACVSAERAIATQRKITSTEKQMEGFQQKASSGDRAAQERYVAANNALAKLRSDLLDSVTTIAQPRSPQSSYAPQFENCLQSLFLDRAHHRLYFNRCAMDVDHPENLIGVFPEVEHTLGQDNQVNEFLVRFPYYRQILAVSPDGKYACSGTHLFNAEDFTAVCELPVPTTAVAFAADSRSLYLADPYNQQIDPFPIPGLAPKADAAAGKAGGGAPPAGAAGESAGHP